MIVRDKVGLMSKMAMFEKSADGRVALKEISFFKPDYLRWEILKTAASVTAGYGLILVLAILYNLEYLIKNATKLDYKMIGTKVLGIYLIVMVIYLVFTFFYSTYNFNRRKRKFVKYNKMLIKLDRMNNEEMEADGK